MAIYDDIVEVNINTSDDVYYQIMHTKEILELGIVCWSTCLCVCVRICANQFLLYDDIDTFFSWQLSRCVLMFHCKGWTYCQRHNSWWNKDNVTKEVKDAD